MPWSNLAGIEYTRTLFEHWDALIFLAAVPLIFIAGKYLLVAYFILHGWMDKGGAIDRRFDLQYSLIEEDNKAVCIALAGLEAGLALTAWGALYDQDLTNYSKNIVGGFVWFFIGVVFMVVFFVFTDKITLRKANITGETKKGNVAAALCVASNCVTSGIVALYTIGGGVDRWDEAIGSAVLYFVLCRVFLSLTHFVLMIVFRRFGGIEHEIGKGNAAAGVLLFMMQTGASIFITNPMRSSEELLAFLVWCVIAIGATIAMDYLMLYVIVTRDGIKEFEARHWGGVFVEGCGVIAAALAVIPFLPNTCAYTAQLTQTFSQRLFSTKTTEELFQWPNLFYLVLIVIYICVAKVMYVLPTLVWAPVRLWRYMLRFFLAVPTEVEGIIRQESSGALTKGDHNTHSSVYIRPTVSEGDFHTERSMLTLDRDTSAGDLTATLSMISGKARGRKNQLLKEASGLYTRIDAEQRSGALGPLEDSLPAPGRREGDGDAIRTSQSTALAPSTYAKRYGRHALSREQSSDLTRELSQPLSMVTEASIDFAAMAAADQQSQTAGEPHSPGSAHVVEQNSRISDSRAISFGGLLLAIGYLLRASFATTIGSSVLQNYEIFMYTLFWLGVSTVMLMVGTVLQSLILWRRFTPPSRTNVASGIVLFGLLISVSLQASSSIMANQEDGPFDLSSDLPEALLVYVIQTALVAASGYVYQHFTAYDDKTAVDEGNVAAAVANVGALIASTFLASAPTSKTSELLTFAAFFVIGTVCTFASARFIARKVIFGGRSTDEEIIRDRNWGAAAVEAAIAMGTAYAYSALLPELCKAEISPAGGPSTTMAPYNFTTTPSP